MPINPLMFVFMALMYVSLLGLMVIMYVNPLDLMAKRNWFLTIPWAISGVLTIVFAFI